MIRSDVLPSISANMKFSESDSVLRVETSRYWLALRDVRLQERTSLIKHHCYCCNLLLHSVMHNNIKVTHKRKYFYESNQNSSNFYICIPWNYSHKRHCYFPKLIEQYTKNTFFKPKIQKQQQNTIKSKKKRKETGNLEAIACMTWWGAMWQPCG